MRSISLLGVLLLSATAYAGFAPVDTFEYPGGGTPWDHGWSAKLGVNRMAGVASEPAGRSLMAAPVTLGSGGFDLFSVSLPFAVASTDTITVFHRVRYDFIDLDGFHHPTMSDEQWHFQIRGSLTARVGLTSRSAADPLPSWMNVLHLAEGMFGAEATSTAISLSTDWLNVWTVFDYPQRQVTTYVAADGEAPSVYLAPVPEGFPPDWTDQGWSPTVAADQTTLMLGHWTGFPVRIDDVYVSSGVDLSSPVPEPMAAGLLALAAPALLLRVRKGR